MWFEEVGYYSVKCKPKYNVLQLVNPFIKIKYSWIIKNIAQTKSIACIL